MASILALERALMLLYEGLFVSRLGQLKTGLDWQTENGEVVGE